MRVKGNGSTVGCLVRRCAWSRSTRWTGFPSLPSTSICRQTLARTIGAPSSPKRKRAPGFDSQCIPPPDGGPPARFACSTRNGDGSAFTDQPSQRRCVAPPKGPPRIVPSTSFHLARVSQRHESQQASDPAAAAETDGDRSHPVCPAPTQGACSPSRRTRLNRRLIVCSPTCCHIRGSRRAATRSRAWTPESHRGPALTCHMLHTAATEHWCGSRTSYANSPQHPGALKITPNAIRNTAGYPPFRLRLMTWHIARLPTALSAAPQCSSAPGMRLLKRSRTANSPTPRPRSEWIGYVDTGAHLSA